MDERLKRQLEFILEADKMKNIFRQNIVLDRSKYENDAEHSWHFALMAMVLSEYADEKVDLLRVMKMALIHDIVEIYAGDTFAYDEKENLTKRQRELEAADKVFGILPQDIGEEYRSLWDEFDRVETPDAIFAASIDRLQPFLLNANTEGYTWQKNSVKADSVRKRLSIVEKGIPCMKDEVDNIINSAEENGWLK